METKVKCLGNTFWELFPSSPSFLWTWTLQAARLREDTGITLKINITSFHDGVACGMNASDESWRANHWVTAKLALRNNATRISRVVDLLTWFWSWRTYRDRLKGVHILLSNSQAGPGRWVKQEQRGIFQSRVGALNGVNSPKPPTELMSEKSDQWVSRWVGQWPCFGRSVCFIVYHSGFETGR